LWQENSAQIQMKANICDGEQWSVIQLTYKREECTEQQLVSHSNGWRQTNLKLKSTPVDSGKSDDAKRCESNSLNCPAAN
jgi:hypothetical protein